MQSIFIYSYKILYFQSADRALFEIFTASYTGSIMLTWHINTIFIILTTNNACIRRRFLTNKCNFDTADISLTRPNFKYSLIQQLERLTILTLIRKPHPRTISSAHIFNVIFSLKWCNRSMSVR